MAFMCAPSLIAPNGPPAPLVDGDHHREMAGRLRQLARLTRSPGIRREPVDLAKCYDRRGEYFDSTSRRIRSAAPIS
jgi:hypothetical protein